VENLLPLCGKVPETRFHCVEDFPKHVSIVWKNPGNRFPLCGKRKGLETRGGLSCGGRGQRGQKWVPCRGTFWKSAFHAVEKPHNLGSMPWNFSGGAEKRRLSLRGAGKASGGRVDIIPEPCRFKSTVDFVFRLDAPPPTPTTPEPRRSADSPAPHWNWPLELATLSHWQHENEFLAPKRVAARESRRFPLFHAWAEVCNLSGEGVIFRHARCNQGKEGTT
jgi:hypothetical protein